MLRRVTFFQCCCKCRNFRADLFRVEHLRFLFSGWNIPFKLCRQRHHFSDTFREMFREIKRDITAHAVTENIDLRNFLLPEKMQNRFRKKFNTERLSRKWFPTMTWKIEVKRLNFFELR